MLACDDLWSWGSNSSGLLGLGDEEDRHRASRIPRFWVEPCAGQEDEQEQKEKANPPPSSTKARTSGSHSLLVDPRGQVWAFGCNSNGESGADPRSFGSTVRVPVLLLQPAEVSEVACGWSHSALITEAGHLFTWGQSTRGALGLGASFAKSQSFVFTPTRVRFPSPTIVDGAKEFKEGEEGTEEGGAEEGGAEEANEPRAVSVAAGFRHTLVLAEHRRGHRLLYGCGANRQGQLGLEDGRPRFSLENCSPRRVDSPDDQAAASGNSDFAGDLFAGVSAGWEFSVLWGPAEIWTTGSNKHGQLGESPALFRSRLGWEKIAGLPDLLARGQPGQHALDEGCGGCGDSATPLFQAPGRPSDVAELSCGWNHVVLRTRDGRAFGWGRSNLGQLGSSRRRSPVAGPVQLETPWPANPVVGVSCGAESSHLVLRDGTLLSSGWNEHGNLGLGHAGAPDKEAEFSETPLVGHVLWVSAGGASVFAGTSPPTPIQ